jgi:hypothetical protein
MNIHRGKCYAQTRYLLDWHCANKYGHEIPFYRPATYLFRENDFYETAIMPVYTKNCSNPDNTTVIPAGTEFCYDLAVSFSPFEEVVWGKKADLIGRIMNSPLKVEVYPRLTTKDEGWSDHPVSTLSGKRMCDYQTSGVR